MYIMTEMIFSSIIPFASHVLQETTELSTDLGLFLEAPVLGTHLIDLFNMALRTALVYIATLLLVRIGEKRLLGKNTALDVVIGIILGSVLSRAVNGSAPLLPALVAGLVLVGMHWLLAFLSIRSDRLSTLTKGRSRVLVKDGEIDWEAMRKSKIGERDLQAAVRSGINSSSLDDVQEARLERGGEISVIRTSRPRILEVSVAEGVQTVRIQID